MSESCGKCVLKSNQVFSLDEIAMMRRYVPYRIAKEIGESDCCLFENKIKHLEGSIAYLDIVGFTHIVSEFVSNKKDVAEISDAFSSYYSVVVETLREFSGSVYQFAGDSLLIGFDRLEGETPEENFTRSFAAMYRAWELSVNYNEVLESANGFAMHPKIGMSYGKFYQLLLGDLTRFVTPVYSGEAIRSAVQSEKHCSGQSFVISGESFALAQKAGVDSFFVSQGDGFYAMQNVSDSFMETASRPEYFDLEALFERPLYYNRLRAFINPMILHQIKNKFDGFIGDYREATCVMVRFEGSFTQTAHTSSLEEGYANFNAVYEMMQDKASKYGSFCNQPDLSDKGLVFPVLFGVPVALEQKEKAAVFFTAEIMKAGKELPFVTSMNAGVAGGTVYSGEFGALTRKDFTVVGNIINLAARLMMYSAQKEKFSFLIDEITQKKVDPFCVTEWEGLISLKGFAEQKNVYRVLEQKTASRMESENAMLFGRDDEFNRLRDAFNASAEGVTTALPVTGDAGVGKSFLVNRFTDVLSRTSPEVRVLYSFCFPYESSTLFFSWRSIVKTLLSIPEHAKENDALCITRDFFAEHFPQEMDWLTFFMNALGYNFKIDDSIETINASIRQARFLSIVSNVISVCASVSPLVIVLEDIQWSDTVSLNMFSDLVKNNKDLKLLLIPIARELPHVVDFFAELSLDALHLDVLGSVPAMRFTHSLLNLQQNHSELCEQIINASGRNPFFIENIVHNLFETGVIRKADGGKNIICGDLTKIQIPSSMQNIILAKLNALPFDEQIVVKAAAVIGRTFRSSVLRRILPEGIGEQTFKNALEHCVENNFMSRDDSRLGSFYFKNITVRDVVYDTILENTRKDINSHLLHYFEELYKDKNSGIVERLSYHALEAKEYEKVWVYARQAAKKAEERFAVRDAVEHYLVASDAYKHLEQKPAAEELFAVELALADSYRHSGRTTEAIERYLVLLHGAKESLVRSAVLMGLGKCYQMQERLYDAISVFEQALEELGGAVPSEEKCRCVTDSLSARRLVKRFFATNEKESTQNAESKNENAGAQNTLAQNTDAPGASAQTAPTPNTQSAQNAADVYALKQIDILFILGKMYFFYQPQKFVWCALENFKNMLANRVYDKRRGIIIANFAVALVNELPLDTVKALFECAKNAAARSGSRTATSIVNVRYGFFCLQTGAVSESIPFLGSSLIHFRNSGGRWELTASYMVLLQNYFLLNDFDHVLTVFDSAKDSPLKPFRQLFEGWIGGNVYFVKYLRGEYSASEATAALLKNVEKANLSGDHLSLSILYAHLAFIAQKSNNSVEALLYADKIFAENRRILHAPLFFRVSYARAIEVVSFAYEQNTVPQKDDKRLYDSVKDGLKSLEKIAASSALISGVTARSRARFLKAQNKKAKAIKEALRAVSIFEKTEYKGEYMLSLLTAVHVGADTNGAFSQKLSELAPNVAIQNILAD